MNRFAPFAPLLLAALVLSGCSGKDTAATVDAGDGRDDADGDGLPLDGVDGGLEGLLVRTASLAPDAPNGTAPLPVVFAVEAEDGGNATRWTLDFGDGSAPAEGPSVPATANHTYVEAGAFNATLTVEYADGEASEATATVVVLAGGPVPGTVLREEPFAVAGTILVGTQGAEGCGVEGSYDRASHPWVFTANEADGTPTKVGKVVVHMDLGATNADSDIYLLDPAGNVVGSSTAFNYAPVVGSGSPTEDFTVEGVELLPGTYTIQVLACVGAEAEYEITATATYVVA